MQPHLGTQIRQLIDVLDGGVDSSYRTADLCFRARFFPYFQLLIEKDGLSVGELAARLGFTQPAVTQSLALMRAEDLVETRPSSDRRERRYRLTSKARGMLPELQRLWAAVARAAERLDRSLPAPLAETVQRALAILSQTSFQRMIDEELQFADDSDPVPRAVGRPGGRPTPAAG